MFSSGILDWHLYSSFTESLQMDDIAASLEYRDLVVLEYVKDFGINVDSKARVFSFKPGDQTLEDSNCNTELFFESSVVLINSSSCERQLD